MLEAYALISHHREHHGTELAAFLHRGGHVARAQQLRDMIRDLLTEAAETGDLRDDVAPDELASYCLYALTAASSLPPEAFEAAADEGVLVRDLPDRRAHRGWEDYCRMGEELVEWVRALRTPDLRAAGSGGGA